MDEKEFLSPGAEYGGVTLWMLNDELEPKEIARQLEGFRAAGWGALITRTFVGLRTEYLSAAWMDIVAETVRVSGRLGMKVWLQAGYMPSGIPDLAPEMAHRVLVRKAKDEPRAPGERVLSEDEAHVYCERVLDHVLDLVSPEAVSDYLEKAYELPWIGRFGKEFGGTVEAIWVDEPHFLPPLLPWGARLGEEFERRWGYSLAEHLPSLFSEAGDFRKVRHQYWRTVLAMFLDAYFEQVGRWCREHGVKFSGHLMGEDTLQSQVAWTGAAMPCYEHMQLPGIDHLTMSLTWPSNKKFLLTPKQCSSAASQLGLPEVLSEMYGVSSQRITFEERKRIGDWLAVLGINYRCFHGSFYSMRGRRKRIYVPHLSYQQPWWPDNRLVADYFARLSYALRRGRYRADCLVLHPVESAFCLYDPAGMDRPHDRTAEPEDLRALDDCLVRLSENLLRIHRGFEYGDETIMARHGEVTEEGLSVGRMVYRVVILPSVITLRKSTVDLLKRFAETGGSILSVGDLPSRVDGMPDESAEEFGRIVEAVRNDPEELKRALDRASPAEIELDSEGGAGDIWVHARQVDNARLYFLANTGRDDLGEVEVKIRGSGRLEHWDLRTGEVRTASQRPPDGHGEGEFTVTELPFPPSASHLLVLREKETATEIPRERPRVSRTCRLSERGRLRRHSPNALTLDYCRFRRGDAEWSEMLPVICVQGILEREGYQGPVTLRFRFSVETGPESISVVVEDAREYEISVNGQSVEYSGSPYYVDRSFHPVEVTRHVRAGENTIEISRDFRPVGKSAFGLASLFESRSGVELESIYLVGDFAVRGALSCGEKGGEERPNCVRYRPEFVLAEEKETSGGDLPADGYPFFAGRMSLVYTVKLDRPREGERAVLVLPGLDAALAKVHVNGREAEAICWAPYETEITSLVEDGDNEIEIELVGTLRNLLGPHHRPSGEPDDCWGTDFDFHPGWLERPDEREANWTDDYFFVRFGMVSGSTGGVPTIEYRTEYRTNDRETDAVDRAGPEPR